MDLRHLIRRVKTQRRAPGGIIPTNMTKGMGFWRRRRDFFENEGVYIDFAHFDYDVSQTIVMGGDWILARRRRDFFLIEGDYVFFLIENASVYNVMPGRAKHPPRLQNPHF